MNTHPPTYSATPNEPVPSLRFSGVNDDLIVLAFAGDDGLNGDVALYLHHLADPATWLREFATRLTEFAELVEVREMGAAS